PSDGGSPSELASACASGLGRAFNGSSGDDSVSCRRSLMEPYRLYILNSFNDDIADERQFMANNDETAVWIAEGLQHSRPMELWHRASKIHAWQPIAS